MKLKNYLIIIVNAAIIIVLFELFGGKGLWGYLIITSIIGIYKLIRNWGQVMVLMRYLETMFFGKPLDRELWEKGEFKNRKKKKGV